VSDKRTSSTVVLSLWFLYSTTTIFEDAENKYVANAHADEDVESREMGAVEFGF
jgi:hypothetical protein